MKTISIQIGSSDSICDILITGEINIELEEMEEMVKIKQKLLEASWKLLRLQSFLLPTPNFI
jgi:ATP phosphoribosyltransferase